MNLYKPEIALQLLRKGSQNPNALFREGQEDAIRHAVDGNGRLLVVQKTGWGKSFVYFIAAKLLRNGGMGPTLLISPLLSLMRNQISAAERAGVRAATINSDNRDEWSEVAALLRKDEVDILLISPERLGNPSFMAHVMAMIAPKVSMLVIDEAHCVSDWGHDFRPHYRLIERMLQNMPRNLRVLATTATANQRVMDDLREVLGPDLQVMCGDLNRHSLTLQTIRIPRRTVRMAWLAETLPKMNGSGIIYVLTRRHAEVIAEWLRAQGIEAHAYMGGGADNEALEQRLLNNEVKALVATTALGMGFDKPDLAFVIHFQSPGSVVGYYQQVGRAGRAIPNAYGVLLSGEEDDRINSYFVDRAFPSREEVEQILVALRETSKGLSLGELLNRLNLPRNHVEKTLQLLTIESPAPVVKDRATYKLTASSLGEGFWERAERLTALRNVEKEQMREYVDLPFGEHMKFLIDALDGNTTAIHPPGLPELSGTLEDPGLVQKAVEFVKGTNLMIQPRKRWPLQSGMNDSLGALKAERRCEAGRALAWWEDDGWGTLVSKGKYELNAFPDDLVKASARLIRTQWKPDPIPTWLTWIPSARRPHLVPDFAKRLAIELGIPAIETLVQRSIRPEQKSMQNSHQQAQNLLDGLELPEGVNFPAEPVLLVDDLVDSRWTFTIAGCMLRDEGCPAVLPFALAISGAQSDD